MSSGIAAQNAGQSIDRAATRPPCVLCFGLVFIPCWAGAARRADLQRHEPQQRNNSLSDRRLFTLVALGRVRSSLKETTAKTPDIGDGIFTPAEVIGDPVEIPSPQDCGWVGPQAIGRRTDGLRKRLRRMIDTYAID
jgi:hypothetical protein